VSCKAIFCPLVCFELLVILFYLFLHVTDPAGELELVCFSASLHNLIASCTSFVSKVDKRGQGKFLVCSAASGDVLVKWQGFLILVAYYLACIPCFRSFAFVSLTGRPFLSFHVLLHRP
jgi:hypothetical protein